MKTKRYIYGLKNKRSGKFFYIGQTSNIAGRLAAHKTAFRPTKFFFVILECCSDEFRGWLGESKWIHYYKKLNHPLFNKNDAGMFILSKRRFASVRNRTATK